CIAGGVGGQSLPTNDSSLPNAKFRIEPLPANATDCHSVLFDCHSTSPNISPTVAREPELIAELAMAEDAPLVYLQTPSPSETYVIAADIRAFLNKRYLNQHGQYWLGYIEGDPVIERMHTEWYELPRKARAITDRYVEL